MIGKQPSKEQCAFEVLQTIISLYVRFGAVVSASRSSLVPLSSASDIIIVIDDPAACLIKL